MKKKITPRKRKPSKNIMLMTSRYRLVVKAARASGYRVCIGPKSQIGAFITDAAVFYSNARAKIGKGKKHATDNGNGNTRPLHHPQRIRTIPIRKDNPRKKEKVTT